MYFYRQCNHYEVRQVDRDRIVHTRLYDDLTVVKIVDVLVENKRLYM